MISRAPTASKHLSSNACQNVVMFEQKSPEWQAILERINSMHDKRQSHQSEWFGLHQQLITLVSSNVTLRNDINVVSTIASFVDDFDDKLEMIDKINVNKIGDQSSLWWTVHAIAHEWNKNYLRASIIFKDGISKGIQPVDFINTHFQRFCNRAKTLISRYESMDLGEINGVHYSYNGRSIVGEDGVPLSFQFFDDIGYIPTQKSMIEDTYQPGYNPALLMGTDGAEMSFEEARANKMGFGKIQIEQSPIGVTMQDFKASPIHLSFTNFDGDKVVKAPTSILKNKRSTPRSNTSKVQISMVEKEVLPQKKRKPTPTSKQNIGLGFSFQCENAEYEVKSQLGQNSYLAESASANAPPSVVIKKCDITRAQRIPSDVHFCQCLMSPYFCYQYLNIGKFSDVIAIANEKPDECVCLYYLSEMLKIISVLEREQCSHSAIDPEHLLLRMPQQPLPAFDDGEIWAQNGLTLCAMDHLQVGVSHTDRDCVLGVFRQMKEPKRKNDGLWGRITQVLSSNQSVVQLLDDVIEYISERKNANAVKSHIARINVKILGNK